MACLASVIRPTHPTCINENNELKCLSRFAAHKTYEDPFDFLLYVSGKRYLIPRLDRDLLSDIVPARADVDQVDTPIT